MSDPMTHQILAQIRTDLAGMKAELARDIASAKGEVLSELDAVKAQMGAMQARAAQGGGGGGDNAQMGEHLSALGQATGRMEQNIGGLQQRLDAILARMG